MLRFSTRFPELALRTRHELSTSQAVRPRSGLDTPRLRTLSSGDCLCSGIVRSFHNTSRIVWFVVYHRRCRGSRSMNDSHPVPSLVHHAAVVLDDREVSTWIPQNTIVSPKAGHYIDPILKYYHWKSSSKAWWL